MLTRTIAPRRISFAQRAARSRPMLSVSLFAISCILYAVLLHPWIMNWGATPADQQMALPGDELVPHPKMQFTRAISVNAPASTVWQWLVQLGQNRAGFYSYDWLENLTGAAIHNDNVIRPEWQTRVPGDGIPMAPVDYLGGRLGEFTVQRIVAVEPGQAIVGNGFTYAVLPVDEHTARLLVRERGVAPGNLLTRLFWDPTHFVMQRQMLHGIKARAEGYPNPPPVLDLPARAGWYIAGLVVLAFFLSHRRRWLWLAAPIGVALPALAFGHDLDAALAGFLAIGITILGALMFGRRWWGYFLTLGIIVLLTLLLAPDAYLAFGLTFLIVIVAALLRVSYVRQRRATANAHPLIRHVA